MKTFRDLLRREAGRVWREKAQARALGLFMGEETLTETVLLRLAVQAPRHGIVVRPFTKAEETRNGADWEFWFISGRSAVGLRVQAKRIFPGGSYNSLDPTGPQIQTLISSSSGLFPAFVFYNDSVAFQHPSPICHCPEYRGESYRGCTLASANSVKAAGSNDSGVLRGYMIPLHCLFCTGGGGAKRGPLPDIVRINLNARGRGWGEPTCNVLETPEAFARFMDGTDKIARRDPQYGDPSASEDYSRLGEYLDSRELAGLALFSGVEEGE